MAPVLNGAGFKWRRKWEWQFLPEMGGGVTTGGAGVDAETVALLAALLAAVTAEEFSTA